MTWTINISYQTGNSFGNEDACDEIGCSWTDLNKAKEALQRIKSHYDAYAATNDYWSPKGPQAADFAKEPWFWKQDPGVWQHCLIVERDDGTEQRISAFWCGYFETLYSAEIVSNASFNTDMKVTF